MENPITAIKLHTLSDMDYVLILRMETITLRFMTAQIVLSQPGEIVYRDLGYFEVACKGYNATMKRAVRDHPLGIRDKMRNKRISS